MLKISAHPRTFATTGNDRTSLEKSRGPKPKSLKKVGAPPFTLLTDITMTLRKSLLALTFSLFALSAFAFTETLPTTAPTVANAEQAKKIEAMLGKMSSKDLSNLSIREVEDLTGHKFSFKEKVALKVLKMKAKKMKKKAAEMSAGTGHSAPGLEKGTYIILAILIPFVAVGLATDWEGNDWLVCLLLTCLCGIPGIIYALIKMKDYYG
jgi:uncharacterized membrane protein YqaE (UPF0057 family)